MARTPLIAWLVLAAAAAACGEAGSEREAPADSSQKPAGTPTIRTTTADSAGPTITLEARLEDRDGGASIRVTLAGLEPELRYPVQIHEGGCAGVGRVSLPLGRVTARTDGTGSVRMTVDGDRLPERPFSVRVQGPDGATACTEIDG